jgi:DNA-directed RNA polymerase specialized sigma24 family protein
VKGVGVRSRARTTSESPGTTVEAFAAFAKEAEPLLTRALVALYGIDVGHDAANEALVEGWRRWDRVAAMTNPVGYLYAIGRSYGRRCTRAAAPVFPLPPADHTPWIEPGLPAALTALPERQRQAVLLIHAHGWTFSEVAVVLGALGQRRHNPTIPTRSSDHCAILRQGAAQFRS